MNAKALALTIAGVTGIALAGSVHAGTVIGSYELEDSGGFHEIIPDLTFNVNFGMSSGLDPNDDILFDDLGYDAHDVSAATVGTTWVASPAATDAMVAQFQDGDMSDGIGIFTAISDTEVSWYGLLEFAFGDNGLDLTTLANETDEIRVTLTSFEVDIPGQDFFGDGIWTDYDATYLWEFVSVPTPGSMCLLGFAAVASRRRRRA